MQPKHFSQIRSLAHILFLQPPSPSSTLAVLEVAAGRAYSSLYLAHLLQLEQLKASFIVLDRASTKGKADKLLRPQHPDSLQSVSSFRRIRIDLADFWMHGLSELAHAHDIRIVGKHVCGVALDMTLNAIVSFVHAKQYGTVTLVLATCCRSLCQFSNMGGQVLQSWGIAKSQFDSIRRMATWGLGSQYEVDMEHVGQACRRFVDVARVEWLRREGWDAHLGTYSDRSNGSPEGGCIVAVWKPQPVKTG